MTTPRVMMMNGVNLNLTGRRDPAHYGAATLAEIEDRLVALGRDLGLAVECFQSNDEGRFIEKLHAIGASGVRGLLINAGAWTHYSWAIHDALAALDIPAVEVHMSNIHAREEFRRVSVLSAVVRGGVFGFGAESYLLALRALAGLIQQ